jgi:hypothetical protein
LCLFHSICTRCCKLRTTCTTCLQVKQRAAYVLRGAKCVASVQRCVANKKCNCDDTVAFVKWRRGPESNRPTRICKHGNTTLLNPATTTCNILRTRCAQTAKRNCNVLAKSVQRVLLETDLTNSVQ